MLTTILLVVAAFVVLGGVVLAVWWVRRIEDELDYPEAHRSAAPRRVGRSCRSVPGSATRATPHCPDRHRRLDRHGDPLPLTDEAWQPSTPRMRFTRTRGRK